jgi:D-alanyl-lipoteichoic acid acyltransferase DltB (MBOAT superfamily)
MLFNSFTFLVFFVFVYASFWLLPTWNARKMLLLWASYLFYAAWNPPYAALLLASTAVDWWLARLIGRTESQSRRRLLLIASLVCNLGMLSFFKYGNFLLENFAGLLSAFGVAYHPPVSSIVLPIGISFYTFASLSYTIDVYRRDIKADWRFADYALFVSFFPHLVAGPIVRASYLLPQIVAPRMPNANQVGWGLAMVMMGLFAKVVMADAIFAPVVDRYYAAPATFGAADAWAAVIAFSGQIFYDFSGYSLCAIGLALCFGFSFPDNFRHPYAARGFADFWRRWHISLSSWLRDYLYIPLGGNRHGALRTYGHLLITMLIGGLWHGASWMFVLWGALHGVYLALEHGLRRFFPDYFATPAGRYKLYELFVFFVVTLTWIPFRAAGPEQAYTVLSSLFSSANPAAFDSGDLLAILAMLGTVGWHIALRDSSLEQVLARAGSFLQTCTISACLIGLFLYSGGDQRAFIYFQF